MRRVAVVAPAGALRDVLVRVADMGMVEIGPASGQGETPAGAGTNGGAPGKLALSLALAGHPVGNAALSVPEPDLDELERSGRYDLLAGEAQLESYAAMGVRRSGRQGWRAGCRPAG